MARRNLRPEESGRTPTLEGLIRTAIESYLVQINTSMPGRIESFDSENQTATVQPLFRRTFADDSQVDLPQITNVPVQFPRSSMGSIYFPVGQGDPCLLIFSQRSLDNWQQSGDIVDPDDDRMFDLSDAVAIPGVSANGQGITIDDPAAVELRNDQGLIQIKPDGTFQIKGASEELLAIVVELFDLINVARTNTMLGPQPFTNLADFAALKARLETLVGG